MKKIYKYLLLVAVSAGGFSCESLVADLNEDPNNPGDAPAELMLPGVELANAVVHEGNFARLAGIWSGYFTGSDRQYINYNQYSVTAGDFDNIWSTMYAGVVKNARLIQQKAEEINNPALGAVAKIIEANTVGTAADLFGDVPYSEAFNPDIQNPAFDPQTQVYASVQALLSEAITTLEEGRGTIPATSIHGLSIAAWIEVAHTLKARYFLHTKEYAKAYEEALMGISTAANSMIIQHGSTYDGDLNLYNAFLDWDRTGYMSAEDAYAPTLLFPEEENYRGNAKTNEGARANFAYIPDAVEKGYVVGYEPNFLGMAYYSVPEGLFGAEAPFYIVSYQENLLILAETGAHSQGFEKGLEHLNDFRAYMNTGGYINPGYIVADNPLTPDVNESNLLYEPYVEADFDAAGIENMDAVAPLTALMREIIQERYITFIGHIEGFNDIRRIDDPALKVNIPVKFGNQIPERFLYPQDEVNSNPNVPSPLPGLFDPTPVNM